MKSEKRTDSEITASNLRKIIEERYHSYMGKSRLIESMNRERLQLHDEIRALYGTLKTIAKLDPKVDITRIPIPEYFKINLKAGGTLADHIESILQEYGALSRNEIAEKLKLLGVPMSEKNARIVLANAINRDKMRFHVTEDGKVELVKPTEEAGK